MNEMYSMSIVTHSWGVIGVLAVVFLNMLVLSRADDIRKYRKFMSVFTPIGSVLIGSVIFTGVVMMAAKHLDFTFANIVMILFSIVFIVMEVKRSKEIKFADVKLDEYKKYGMKILVSEIVVILGIGIYMWYLV